MMSPITALLFRLLKTLVSRDGLTNISHHDQSFLLKCISSWRECRILFGQCVQRRTQSGSKGRYNFAIYDPVIPDDARGDLLVQCIEDTA